MRPNPGNVQQPTLPRRIWRGATRGRAGGSGRLEDGASPSWAPRRGRGRALLTSRNSAELANEPGARTWATPLAGRGRSPGDLFRTAGSEQSVSGSSRHLWPKDGRRPSAGTVEGAGGVCQEVLTLQLSRRVLDPGVSKGGVPQEPRVNAQHVWLSRQGRSASPSWVEAGMLLHPKTAPRTPCSREAPWARLGTGAQQPGGHAGPGGVSQEGPSRARLRSWPGRGYPTGNELWDAGAQR